MSSPPAISAASPRSPAAPRCRSCTRSSCSRLASGDQATIRRPQDHHGLPRQTRSRRSTATARMCACRSATAPPVDTRLTQASRHPRAAGTGDVDPKEYDLACWRCRNRNTVAWRARSARLDRARQVPCMSIMNMPPLPYMKRIPGLDDDALSRLHRRDGLGQFRAREAHAVQPRPAGDPPARRKEQFPAGDAADQFQMARFGSDADTTILRNWRTMSMRSATTRRKARSTCR